ncbi:MAG: polysaccharide deacetylase family protein [Planctomycetota bacterium]|jgi:polysaccharide deacetylase family protein (PEP-CTERM system associated)
MTRHAISVDLEDWYQTTVDPDADLPAGFQRNIEKLLSILAARNTRGTFFVLGITAKKAPDLIKAIADAGHEMQSHGYSHRSVFDLTEQQFREDLTRAKGLVEDITGREVFGFRAPDFSIDGRTLWAFDVLVETGHRYDSSIFPVKTSRYGIDGYPPEPRIVTTPSGRRLVEAPVACFDCLGKRRPVAGGGYFRLWPYFVIRKAWRQLERARRPGIFYVHPSEFDPHELKAYRDSVPWMVRLHQSLGRRGLVRKIDRLLGDFDFGSVAEAIGPLLSELEKPEPASS